MALLAIEINDAAVTAADAGGTLVSSPGFALIDARGVSFGEKAARQALLHPTQINHRFWERLSAEPLTQPPGQGLTYRDLAHGHLQTLWHELAPRSDEVVLATPPDYSLTQLGHLAGITQALGMPVRAIVDAALAATSRLPPSRVPWLHLDAQLHRVLLARIDPDGARTAVSVLPGLGLAAMRNTLTRTAARRFLQTSRFDPLHEGASEQALHDQLTGLLQALATAEQASLNLEASGHRYQIQLHRRDLIDALAELRQQLVGLVASRLDSDGTAQLAVGRRLATHVPGLREDLLELGTTVEILDEEAAVGGALASYPRLLCGSNGLHLTTRLDAATMP